MATLQLSGRDGDRPGNTLAVRRIAAALGRTTIGLLALLVAASASFLLFSRSWSAGWGATSRETAMVMPGDDLVAHAGSVTTKAVTVQAPPDQVWPWLVQLGQGRGGLYSYDRAERLFGVDITNADRILPKHQRLAVGDTVWITEPGYPADLVFTVVAVQPPRWLLLSATHDPARGAPAHATWTWSFLLVADGAGRTRLLHRSRNEAPANPVAGAITGAVVDPVGFVMERKTMLGIAQRAGGQPDGVAEPMLWSTLFLGAAGAAVLVVTRRRPWWWRLPTGMLAAAVLSVALFRGFPNPWYGLLADALIAVALLATYRRSRPGSRRLRHQPPGDATDSRNRVDRWQPAGRNEVLDDHHDGQAARVCAPT